MNTALKEQVQVLDVLNKRYEERHQRLSSDLQGKNFFVALKEFIGYIINYNYRLFFKIAYKSRNYKRKLFRKRFMV